MALDPEYQQRLQRYQSQKKSYRKVLKSLKKKQDQEVDGLFEEAHKEEFETTDCLKCGNCCRTTSPIFKEKDIERLSARLKMKPGDFIQEYLTVDEDGDYVFPYSPCPFLGEDNYCSVYEDRPKACRDYPHTNERKMRMLLKKTEKNADICPIVVGVLDRISQKLGS